MMDDKKARMPVHHCPTCGLDTEALDPIDCPGCGTFLKWPTQPETRGQFARRTRAGLSQVDRDRLEDDDYARTVLILRQIAALEDPARIAPGTAARLTARKQARELKRQLVAEAREEGLSIAQTAIRLRITRDYVSQLRRKPRG